MPRSMLGGQHKRTVEKQKRAGIDPDMDWIDPEAVGPAYSLADLSYNELRAFAKDHDISAAGKKDEILARIEAHFHGE